MAKNKAEAKAEVVSPMEPDPSAGLTPDTAAAALDKYEAEHILPGKEKDEAKPESEKSPPEAEQDTEVEEDGGDDEDWVASLSEEQKELADSLGLSEEQLRELSGPEELERHVKLFDQHLYRNAKERADTTGTEAETETEKTPARAPDGKFVSRDQTTGEYKPSLSTDDYDEGIVTEFGKLSQYVEQLVEQRVAKLESLLEHTQAQAAESQRQQVESLIDSLGYDDLFGKVDGTRNAKQMQQRQKLVDAAIVLREGMRSLGQETAWTPTLMKRALNLEFAEQLAARQQKQRAEKTKQRSRQKLGNSGQRRGLGENAPWSGDATKDPVLLEHYYAALRDSGH